MSCSDLLARPGVPLSLAEAPAHLSAIDLRATLHAPPNFDTGPSLAGRIRGALGRALRHRAPGPALARRMALYDLSDAYTALFGAGAAGRPYTLFAETSGRDIRLTLRLFGRAALWGGDVRAALHDALVNGIGIAPMSRVRARFPDASVTGHPCAASPILPASPHWRLITLAPLALERRTAHAPEAAAFIGSLIARSENALAWCGYDLRLAPERRTALQRRAAFHDWAMKPVAWNRYSQRQDRPITMTGITGAATLTLDAPEVSALVAMLSCTGIGSHTTFGLGNAELLPIRS